MSRLATRPASTTGLIALAATLSLAVAACGSSSKPPSAAGGGGTGATSASGGSGASGSGVTTPSSPSGSSGTAPVTGSSGTGSSGTTPTTPPTTPPSGQASGFSPSYLVPGGSSSTVFVAGTGRCSSGPCLQLWSGTAGHFVQVTAPPNPPPTGSGPNLSPPQLIFANAEDGYALETIGPDTNIIANATTDGGKTWHSVTFPSAGPLAAPEQMVATANGDFFAVLLSCPGLKCGNYSLGRSTAGSTTWSSVPIPGAAGAGTPSPGLVQLGAAGDDAWVDFPSSPTSATPRLLEAIGGRAPFVSASAHGLTSGNGECAISPQPGNVIWAYCPQGMTGIYSRSSDGGQHFKGFWQPFQTGGGSFDPISGSIAYRWTGGGGGTDANSGPTLPQTTVQQTSDGGATFRNLAPLPAGTGIDGTVVFAGGGTVQGYLLTQAESATHPVQTLYYTVNGGDSWSKAVFG